MNWVERRFGTDQFNRREMRTGLSSIQQTLTPEAASVLNRSIAEAVRRNHGQASPLHVAATLLASPTGLLRQACVSSHPNSSHPLHCRALDLCFRVALERLPSAGQRVPEMPLSNSLTAALKRAHALQRRGCPENQQQPLLAIKVELQQLIISILDDPSVSKVMREARYSSPAVKAVIEQLMSAPIGSRLQPPSLPVPVHVPSPGRTRTQTQNAYMSPRLEQQGNPGQFGEHGFDEVRNVIDIMMRRNKRNPILVGESETAAVLKEVLRRVQNGEGLLKNAEVIQLDDQIPRKIEELGSLIESRTGNSNNRGIILDLGDLKWLVEQPVSDISRAAVSEMGKILSALRERGGGGGSGGLWMIGTANCETYLRCQVYHTSMENDWDLQAVPLTPKLPLSGIIPRSSIQNPYVNPLIHLKSSPRARCCPVCINNYEQDLAKLLAEAKKTEANRSPLLPHWMQNAKADSPEMGDDDRTKIFKAESQEQLQKKWIDICLVTHPSFHHNSQPRLELPPMIPLQLSPVRTDLVLGREGPDTFGKNADTFKKLLKSLMEKSWWQKDAASQLSAAVTRTRSRRGGSIKGDMWLLFAGPDSVSKTKMVSVLAEQIYRSDPIAIQLGSSRKEGNNNGKSRGKTPLDKIVEAVRMNPFAVIKLEDIDKADPLLRASIKQATESGRLTDSYGREISLGNIIFILTVKTDIMDDPNETNYLSISSCNRRIEVTVQDRCSKRKSSWIDVEKEEENRTRLLRNGISTSLGISLDLNVLAGDDNNNNNGQLTMTTVPHELAIHMDATIVFKTVNFEAMGRVVENKIKESFAVIVGNEHILELERTAVEKVVGETWLGMLSLDEWIEKVLSPSFCELRTSRVPGETMVVRLHLDGCGLDQESIVDGRNGGFLSLK